MVTKVRIMISIPKSLRDRFYDFVKKKYSVLRGGLSMEAELALASWLQQQGVVSQKTHKIDSTPPAEHLFKKKKVELAIQ